MSWDKEYPRPQLRRENYSILSGPWTMNHSPITVPFPPESVLSGYNGKLSEHMVYETEFMGEINPYNRTLLHFGAVDQVATVYVNNILMGRHEGGYVPFDVDISKVVKNGRNKLRVEVRDNLDRTYPYGKQRKHPGGMWYTPVSGIWQQVWMESIPKEGVFDLQMETDMTSLKIAMLCEAQEIEIRIYNNEGGLVWGKKRHPLRDKNRSLFAMSVDFEEEEIPIHLWSPDHPYLYYLVVETEKDFVQSYFALRKFELRTVGAKQRFYLNNEPLFLNGVLDQGYFQDGIYLPEDPEEYDRDVQRMKELGYNTIRKHIKVEPERFYYACDKYGMIVIQDMVNSGGYSFFFDTLLPTLGMWHRPDIWPWGEKRKKVFEQHSLDIVKKVRNHPCIWGYTIFNEGWGQFEADRMYTLIKKADPTRFVDATSGWFVQNKSDVSSYHIYFRNELLKAKKRPLLLSEAGGYAFPIKDHLYNPDKRYGYGRVCQSEADFAKMLKDMYEEMVIPSIAEGLCGCIYTQLSDVETEINGFYTYDRKVCKVDSLFMKEIAKRVYQARVEAENS